MEQVPMMDDTIEPLEITKAIAKAEKLNDRAVRAAGYGASIENLAITKTYIAKVIENVAEAMKGSHLRRGGRDHEFIKVIGPLPNEVIALCGLQGTLHSVASGHKSTEMFRYAGQMLAGECWAAGLTRHDPKLAERLENEMRLRHSKVALRQRTARTMAKRLGYKVKRWNDQCLLQAGAWLVERVTASMAHVFEWIEIPGDQYVLSLTEAGAEEAYAAVREAIAQHPVYLPKTIQPNPWTDWFLKDTDLRLTNAVAFLRTHYRDTQAACRAAIKDGTMTQALDAVTRLQMTPWRLNKRIFGVIRGCMAAGLEVPGFPTCAEQSMPEKPIADAGTLSVGQEIAWKVECHEVRTLNRTMRSGRLMLVEDMETAEVLHDHDRFWTTMNCDWRGRVYALPHFNFQREDRVRALFEFADGEPLGDEGFYWLKVHLANCGAFNKIDKEPLDARVQWCDDNMDMITEAAECPLQAIRHWWKLENGKRKWIGPEEPFLFLAACMELVSALNAGPSHMTHLPVSFDGSCSGLQHLAAMTRDASTALLVNLTPGEKPNDVYGVIAEDVKARVEADTSDPLSAKFLDYGIDRKLAKRNVMTYSYSSKKFGMASQQQTDLMDALQKDVLRKKIPEHPFEPSHKGSVHKPGRAARYIASHIFEAIEQRINLPAQAMKFLQGLAKTLAHEEKPLRWTSPTGIPWINRYHAPALMTLTLWMHDKGVANPIRSRVAVGHNKEIDKDKASNGVAPNFVHALDAAHLMLTVNAAAAAGITSIATVHDSFGCLASRATEFNKIIRAELVRMYETHDVLNEVLAQAHCDLTQHNWDRLPTVPQAGTLNLQEINDATYAFA